MDFIEPIFAVHLPDGLILGTGIIMGWGIAFLLIFLGGRKLPDNDIPKISFLTAVFFLTSLLPIQIPGGPKTHLLLNGLIGVLLGQHAVLAIAPALLLQSLLFAHGGFLSLGLNICVMTIPALLINILTKTIQKPLLSGKPTVQFLIIFFITNACLFSITSGIMMLVWQFNFLEKSQIPDQLIIFASSPKTILGFMVSSMIISWGFMKSKKGMLFALGFFIGISGVILTIFLHSAIMLISGVPNLEPIIFITCILHIPLGIIEGLTVGTMISFLAKVKPEMLETIGYAPTNKA